MAHLEFGTQGEHQVVELGDTAVIGRSRDADVVLDLDAVSRQHARLVRQDGGYVVEDLGSRNGTFVNGRRIAGPTALADNDVIRVSTAELRYRTRTETLTLDVTMLESTALPIRSMTTIDASATAAKRGVLQPEVALRAVRMVSALLTRPLALDELLSQVLGAVFELCPEADRAVAMLLDETGKLLPIASRARHGGSGIVTVSRTVMRLAVEKKQAILSTDVASDKRFDTSQSLMMQPVRSLMCVPMLSQRDEVLGVIEVQSAVLSHCFTTEALDLLLSIGTTAAVAVENARLHERALMQDRLERDLEHARAVQRSFLPAAEPAVPGYEFFAHYEGAWTVSGDYYGFLELAGGQIAIGIADVSGKGMAAALMMARLASEVRFALQDSADPAHVLQAVNASLFRSDVDDRFVTMLLMVLDPASHELRIANAGHPPALLRHADGRVEPIGGAAAGVPLNVSIDPALAPPTTTHVLAPGDVVLAFTDGISEAWDAGGGEFGTERIVAALGSAPGNATAAGQAVVAAVRDFTGGVRQRDDTTVISIGRTTGH